jgi:GTP-binding protein HflX
MVMQRLDTLVTLTVSGEGFARRGGGVTGYIKEVYLAHLLPEPEKWSVSDALSLDALSEENFLELVEQLETQFRREYVARQVDVDQERVILIGLMTAKITEAQFESSLAELERLVDSAGGEVLEIIRQKRSHVDPQSVVGSGKVEEIALIAQTLGANVIVFDRSLSPAQVKNLEQQIGVRVVDRTEVILDIFAQRAQSRAGKLQVELAQLEYMLPRLTGRGKTMSKLGGGIGTRGPGETKLETERRAIQQRINKLQKEVTQLQAHRSRLRQKRQHHDIPTVAIIGYTNAGKSTLINALTNAEVYTADQLFATLDPTTRRLSVANEDTGDLQTILLTDTVGFIEQLPPSLVDAFRATLEEVTEADTLLHVVDISHPDWLNQLQAVNKIIKDMSSFPTYTLLAFNKIDQVSPEVMDIAREQFPDALFISASQRLGLDNLRSSLLQI